MARPQQVSPAKSSASRQALCRFAPCRDIFAAMNPAVEKALHDQLEKLLPEEQQKVVEFARTLAARRAAERDTAAMLKRFAGSIPRTDLDLIARAIEEGCEQVNPDEW